MIYDLGNEYERRAFLERVRALEGSGAVVELKKRSPRRTLSQNAYLHLILGWFACEYGAGMEEVKVDFFKRTCNPGIFLRRGVNRRGREVEYLRSTADLDTAEMTTAIERFRNWSSAVAGIYLPAPNEEQYLSYIEREVERMKEWT